jgi:hypothetical protein
MGFMLAHHLQHHRWLCLPGQDEREAHQLRLVLRALQSSDTGVGHRPVVRLQTVTLLSLYFFNKGDIARARDLILTGNTLVRAHDLDTMVREPAPPADPVRVGFKLAPTTLAAETQAAVAQLVYLDLSYAVTLKLPSLIDPQLRANFKILIVSSTDGSHG